MKRFLAVLMLVVCLVSFAHAEEAADWKEWFNTEALPKVSDLFADETQIVTTATVDAMAEIDVSILSFTVEGQGDTVAEANSVAMTNIRTIKQLLIDKGVAENQIWNKRYDVVPNVVYHNTKLTSDKLVDGYLVSIVFCVRLTDIDLVGVVIDTAMQSGAFSTHELEFERSLEKEVYQEALAEAAQMAMEKAERLAQSCGMELGQLVSVEEISSMADGEATVQVTYRAK